MVKRYHKHGHIHTSRDLRDVLDAFKRLVSFEKQIGKPNIFSSNDSKNSTLFLRHEQLLLISMTCSCSKMKPARMKLYRFTLKLALRAKAFFSVATKWLHLLDNFLSFHPRYKHFVFFQLACGNMMHSQMHGNFFHSSASKVLQALQPFRSQMSSKSYAFTILCTIGFLNEIVDSRTDDDDCYLLWLMEECTWSCC